MLTIELQVSYARKEKVYAKIVKENGVLIQHMLLSKWEFNALKAKYSHSEKRRFTTLKATRVYQVV